MYKEINRNAKLIFTASFITARFTDCSNKICKRKMYFFRNSSNMAYQKRITHGQRIFSNSIQLAVKTILPASNFNDGEQRSGSNCHSNPAKSKQPFFLQRYPTKQKEKNTQITFSSQWIQICLLIFECQLNHKSQIFNESKHATAAQLYCLSCR